MSIYDSLNTQQRQAVEHTEGPLLILAGAGSGKTRVLTHRIAYLIEQKGVNPYNILAITFTNKAAGEMRERVDSLVGFGSESIWVSTFHSTCVRILRRYIDRIGYDTNFTIYDSDDSKSVMKEVCKKLKIDTKQLKEKAILGKISHLKDELITPEQYYLEAQADFSKKKIADAYAEYQNMLRNSNALDFDDLIVKTVELLKSDAEVLDYYHERFRYILVDEYQDTNTAQFALVSLLARKYRNLCVVGDDDQSIYKFRGANIGNILNFERVFEDAKVIKLEQNYRSTKTILAAANDVIHNNQGRKDKTLWTDHPEGDRIRFLQLDSGYEEADYIAHDIRELVEKQGRFEYHDCACLYRTNAQSRALEERLVFLNIPYKIVGGVNFYARKEIKDILAYLKTIDNAKDDLAVKRIINIPKRGIGLTTISKITEYGYAHDMSFYEALKCAREAGAGRAAEKIEKFVDTIANFRGKSNFMSLEDLMDDILETTGYVKELEAEGTDEARERIENINELVTKLVDYEQSCEDEEPTLSGFLEAVALVADIDNLDENSNHVTLMTIHSAKGLEFPKVYLCGMEDGLFPSYMTITSDDPTDLEEERRLCYVGITRAMESLTITCAKQRMIRGETQYNKISRFVREIDLNRMDTRGFGRGVEKQDNDRLYAKNRTEAEIFARKPFSQAAFTKSPAGKNPYARSMPATGKSIGTPAGGLDYTVGDTVKHMKFGQGVVKTIISGGRDYEVTVDFEKVGVKKMFAAFAKLKKM